MIFDCFQFFNEIDILKMRLKILDPFVDVFVISEATVTFSGIPKPLYFEENKALFQEFSYKIRHNVVADTPDDNPFERDVFQKNAVKRGIQGCADDDIIIFSDLDELPNPQRIPEILNSFQGDGIYHFAQRQFYFYLNLEETSGNLLSYSGEFPGVAKKQWLGSKLCRFKLLRDREMGELRAPQMKEGGLRVENGGWHFTYMGGEKDTDLAERVAQKIKAAAHQEFNNDQILSNIRRNISKKRDIFGRNAEFKVVSIDETFPEYLRQNQDEFRHLILDENEKGFLSRFKFW